MNPSANGWIKKLFKEIPNDFFKEIDDHTFYKALKQTGFIYGSNLGIFKNLFAKKDFTEEENCKVNLILGLFYIHTKSNSQVSFVESAIQF